LVVVQVLLGLLSVSSLLGLWQVTAHLGVAALLVADLWLLVLSAWPRPDATVIGPPLACAARAASGPEPACR
jgi:heme A synthase